MRVDLQPTDLVAIINTTLDGVTALAKTRSINLAVSFDRSVATVWGDRTRLEQVVSNLLANALKFTPKGGRIDVTLDQTEDLAHLRIRDTGVGIDASFLPRIFNRLTQEDSSSTRRHAGLGLGLAIVRHLVDAHGGAVRAESPGPGRGATFHLTLPLMKSPNETMKHGHPQAKELAQSQAGAPSARIDFRVLVVEDDGALCELLAEILTRAGATVRTAESAAMGLAVFREFRPDVLVCDIAMPIEDGYSFISTVRALDREDGGATPALALTALAGDSDRARALAGGFQRHLTKPVDTEHLTTALAALVANARQDVGP